MFINRTPVAVDWRPIIYVFMWLVIKFKIKYLDIVRTTVIYQPALAASPTKVAFPDWSREAELNISNNNRKTTLKNSWLPKAFTTWNRCRQENFVRRHVSKLKNLQLIIMMENKNEVQLKADHTPEAHTTVLKGSWIEA